MAIYKNTTNGLKELAHNGNRFAVYETEQDMNTAITAGELQEGMIALVKEGDEGLSEVVNELVEKTNKLQVKQCYNYTGTSNPSLSYTTTTAGYYYVSAYARGTGASQQPGYLSISGITGETMSLSWSGIANGATSGSRIVHANAGTTLSVTYTSSGHTSYTAHFEVYLLSED